MENNKNDEINNQKKKEKKLNDVFQLTGSNLFMIPCEIKNESFGEMFKRKYIRKK